MIAPPPPPVVVPAPVVYGAVAVRVGPRTSRLELQASGRIRARRRVAPGPRRVTLRVPVGDHALRVRAVGRGGARWSRTTRVLVLPRSGRRAGRVPGFVDARLQADVRSISERTPAVTGVYVQHLVTGCGAAVNADAQFPAASTLKAGILVDAVRRGSAARLRPLLDRMILESSDRAANSVLAALGGGSGELGARGVTETLADLGLSRSLVRRPYIVEDARLPLPIRGEAQPALFTNFVSTPYDLARLMVAIHRGTLGRGRLRRIGIGAATARRELAARLLRVRDATKLGAGLPRGVPLAHKTGYTEEVKHDTGVAYLRSGPVAIAALSWSAAGVSDPVGDGFIAEVGRAAARRLARGGRCDGLPLRG